MKDEENREKVRIQCEDAENRLTFDKEELNKRENASALLSAEIEEGTRRRDEIKSEMQLLQSTRPGFFIYWFSKAVRTQYKKAVASVLSEYNRQTETIAEQRARLQALYSEIEKLKKREEKSKKD